MGVLITSVATGALIIANRHETEGGVSGTHPEPELNLGLNLLANGPRALLMTLAAGKIVMAGVGRPLGMEASLRHEHDDCDCCSDSAAAQQIGECLRWTIGRVI